MRARLCVAIILIAAATYEKVAIAAPQQVVFCADSISYSRSTSETVCKVSCQQYSDSRCPQKELDLGWQITSSSPREVPQYGGCSCVGTQYVLTLPDSKPSVPSTPTNSTPPIDEPMLARREAELLNKVEKIFQKDDAPPPQPLPTTKAVVRKK